MDFNQSMQLLLFAVGGGGRCAAISVHLYSEPVLAINQCESGERERERERRRNTQRASTAGADKMSWFNEACFVFVGAEGAKRTYTQRHGGRGPQ